MPRYHAYDVLKAGMLACIIMHIAANTFSPRGTQHEGAMLGVIFASLLLRCRRR